MESPIGSGIKNLAKPTEPEDREEWIDPVTLVLGKILSVDVEEDDG